MQVLCREYILMVEKSTPNETGLWRKAAVNAARILGYAKTGSQKPGEKKSRMLRRWLHEFISDREEVPTCKWQTSGQSLIDDPDFAQEIHAHLQSLKPSEVTAEAIVRFLDNPEMLERLQRTKTISITTAQKWLHKMHYRWTYDPKGQYVDGHEREDVVDYRQNVFLPAMARLRARQTTYSSKDGPPVMPPIEIRRVVVWYHDESTFYAHDRRRKRWVHQSERAKPYKKGEGASEMAAEFVSAEYGFLCSPDGKESARVLFKAGKMREGYFDNNNIRKQTAVAMELCKKWYPNEDHVFVFDNAKTHTKRADDAQSALRMPKAPSETFGVDVNDLSADGHLQYLENGKVKKKKIPMADTVLPDGRTQSFYFPAGHRLAGWFKGMELILQERGFQNASRMKAQCGKKFSDCLPGSTQCCCRRTLFNEPDFKFGESILEAEVRAQGFERNYRLLPESSKEEDLEKNIIKCLDEIPLITIRRFVTRSVRFMDAYSKGLNGHQAAWASRKYRGHRVIPDTILDELEKASIH
ncbi:hypothetical protein BJ912DRAFT_453668 [Pholiota molesta]|nr:hypothetical protein BJ912DRAFT_453668 [Pholiota molesta]